MKLDYIILAVVNGVTKEFKFSSEEKENAVSTFKNIRMRAERCKFFAVDVDDNDYWFDITNKY